MEHFTIVLISKDTETEITRFDKMTFDPFNVGDVILINLKKYLGL